MGAFKKMVESTPIPGGATIRKYKKLIDNPLSFGVTTIKSTTFSDTDLVDSDKVKLELSIKLELVSVVS